MTPAPHPLDVSGTVELALVERNGLVESRHLGAAVVLGPDGAELLALGDVGATIFPRSSLKPFQAAATLATEVELADDAVAMACASHFGVPQQIAVVERMLAEAGLDETALQCPSAYPLDAPSARAATAARRVFYNCSGKHAAFLAACVHAGWDTTTYLDPAHPLQKSVVRHVEALTEEMISVSGIDGCGAPVHAVTMRGLARGVSRLAISDDERTARILPAVIATPWAIDGPGKPNAIAIERFGILSKTAAEGVHICATPSGISLVLKVLDGGDRAATLIALSLLARVGAIDAAAAEQVVVETTQKILGGPNVVGAIRLAL